MNENGPYDIYKVKPLTELYTNIPIPSCMYKVRSIYATDSAGIKRLEHDPYGDIESCQIQTLERLESLKTEVLQLKQDLLLAESSDIKFKVPENYQDIVIKANPDQLPLSIWVLYNLLAKKVPVQLATFVHSSLKNIPEILHLLSRTKDAAGPFAIALTIIWKDVGKDAEMMIDPVTQGVIAGEVNIVRYISRLLSIDYESDPFLAADIDNWLELAHSSVIHGVIKDRNAALKAMNIQLNKSSFLVGNKISVADIVLWSTITQCQLQQSLPKNVSKWWNMLNALDIFKTPLNFE